MSWDLVHWGVWAELQIMRTFPPSESLSQPVDIMVNVVQSSGHRLPRWKPWRPGSEGVGTIPEAPISPFPQPLALSVSEADSEVLHLLSEAMSSLPFHIQILIWNHTNFSSCILITRSSSWIPVWVCEHHSHGPGEGDQVVHVWSC